MFPFWYIKSFLRTKHRKADCVSFQEGGPPCEDCDLEGHTALCGWHRDWHSCDCGELDRQHDEQTQKKLKDQRSKCKVF